VVNLGSAYGEIQIGTGGAEQSVAGLADKLRSVGQSMSLALTAPLVGLAATGAMATADFEQSMNVMAQVSGATAEQMAKLEQQALDLGATTTFSAGQAAEAQLELAKSGLDVNQVMAAMPGVLDLAAAGGVDLAQAAGLTTMAINSFGLEASAAADIANMFAAAANASSSDISDLGQGFQQAGFAFSATGQKTDDLAASLALLTNVGLTGSDAGTALKNAMVQLMNPTDKAASLMNTLGLNVYDAQGKMLPWGDVIQEVADATEGMTDKQRQSALSTIFLSDGMKAMIPLLDAGRDGFMEMKDQVNVAGAAQAVAAANTQGLAGAFEYIKGTIESTLIAAFLPYTDAVSSMIRQTADMIGMFTALPAPVQNAAMAFAAVLAAAGPVMLAISGIGAALGFLLSPIGLIVIGVAALAAAWSANFLGIQEATAAAWGVIGPVLDQTITGFGYYAEAVADAGLGSIEAQEALSALPGFLQPIALAADSAAAAIQEGWGVLVPQVIATVQTAWQALMTLLEPALTRLQTAFAGTGTQVATLAPHFEALWVAVQTMWTAVQPIVQMFVQLLATELAVTAVFAVNLLATAWQSMGEIVGIVLDQITLMLTTVAALITETVTLVTALLTGDWDTAWQSARNIFQIFANYFKRTLDNMNLLVETVFTAIQTIVMDTLTDLNVDASAIMRQIKTWWDAIWGGFRAVIDPIVGAINGILDAMTNLSNMKFTPPWEGLTPPAWWDPGGWFGGGAGGEPGKNAMGTSFWRGGLSWVGESGPELIDLPRGARVYDAQDSQRMGGRTINITVPVQALNSQLDMVELAHRVAGTILQYEGA
jgi:TP901 family phage tail tape measure protein